MATSRDRNIDRTITNNLRRLCKCGVLTARPGYEITGHQLTSGRTVVAMVSMHRGEALPDSIGGLLTPVGSPPLEPVYVPSG